MMRIRLLMVAVVAAAAFLDVSTTSGQSLGDIARKEAERRGTTAPVTKTYTNDTLTPDFTTPAAVTPPEAAVEKKDPVEPAQGDDEAARQKEREEAEKWGVTPRDQQEPAPEDDHKEEFWRSRSALIKARLASQNAQIDQLRQRMTATQGSSEAERDVVARTFANAEVNLKHLNDEWLRFERQARERKVPESWWR